MTEHPENTKPSNSTKPVLAPVIYWNDFKKIKPNADEEYLVCDYDKIIKISYFDGEKWGYYHNSDDDILFWSLLPSSPI